MRNNFLFSDFNLSRHSGPIRSTDSGSDNIAPPNHRSPRREASLVQSILRIIGLSRRPGHSYAVHPSMQPEPDSPPPSRVNSGLTQPPDAEDIDSKAGHHPSRSEPPSANPSLHADLKRSEASCTESWLDSQHHHPSVPSRSDSQLSRAHSAGIGGLEVPRHTLAAFSGHPSTFASLEHPVPDTGTLHRMLHAQLKSIPTGLVESHLQVMLGLCREFNLIIGIRPVNALAGDLINTLQYPTKPFAIKIKTAKTGPAAGHIPCADNPEQACKLLSAGRAIALPLLLTGNRINELVQRGLLVRDALSPPILDGTANQLSDVLTLKSHPSGQCWSAIRRTPEQAGYLSAHTDCGGIWAIHPSSPDGIGTQPLAVLGHPTLGLPFTSDYDLLTFGIPSPHPRSNPANTQPPITLEHSLVDLLNARRTIAGRTSLESGAGSGTPSSRSSFSVPQTAEDPDWGNASPFLRSLAEAINACINRGGDNRLNLIHHNADCHNPFSSERTIYPALFLLPNTAAMTRDELLRNASADADDKLAALQRLCSLDGLTHGTPTWNNWGAVWVTNLFDFNQLALSAHRHGYVIKKSQAWLGGELPRVTNSLGRIR